VSILHPVLESLTDVVTASDWVYLLIVLIAALDAVFPLVPARRLWSQPRQSPAPASGSISLRDSVARNRLHAAL